MGVKDGEGHGCSSLMGSRKGDRSSKDDLSSASMNNGTSLKVTRGRSRRRRRCWARGGFNGGITGARGGPAVWGAHQDWTTTKIERSPGGRRRQTYHVDEPEAAVVPDRMLEMAAMVWKQVWGSDSKRCAANTSINLCGQSRFLIQVAGIAGYFCSPGDQGPLLLLPVPVWFVVAWGESYRLKISDRLVYRHRGSSVAIVRRTRCGQQRPSSWHKVCWVVVRGRKTKAKRT
ncbi:hypothetical protein C8R46DRAFT_1308641, partial [Mycena filopes]